MRRDPGPAGETRPFDRRTILEFAPDEEEPLRHEEALESVHPDHPEPGRPFAQERARQVDVAVLRSADGEAPHQAPRAIAQVLEEVRPPARAENTVQLLRRPRVLRDVV